LGASLVEMMSYSLEGSTRDPSQLAAGDVFACSSSPRSGTLLRLRAECSLPLLPQSVTGLVASWYSWALNYQTFCVPFC